MKYMTICVLLSAIFFLGACKSDVKKLEKLAKNSKFIFVSKDPLIKNPLISWFSNDEIIVNTKPLNISSANASFDIMDFNQDSILWVLNSDEEIKIDEKSKIVLEFWTPDSITYSVPIRNKPFVDFGHEYLFSFTTYNHHSFLKTLPLGSVCFTSNKQKVCYSISTESQAYFVDILQVLSKDSKEELRKHFLKTYLREKILP